MAIIAGRRPGDGAYGVVDWACGWLGVTYGGEKERVSIDEWLL
jgi:hypothetical protein